MAAVGCRSGASPPAPAEDAGRSATDAAPIALIRAPFGASELAAFDWRGRAGHDSYREATAAEKDSDWPRVIAAARRARAADPDHLEAAWLEAAALARQGAHAEVLAPLQIAAAGDWGKWGERVFELELFAGFRATAAGMAWERVAEQYRAEYAAALARSLIVSAGGDLYAFDPVARRWLRVTRTFGAVRAAIGADTAGVVAYVAMRRAPPRPGHDGKAIAVAVGVVELATGRPPRELALAGAVAKLRFRAAKGALVLEVAEGRARTWDRLDWKRGTRAPSDAKGPRLSPELVVAQDQARLGRIPHADVTADWDAAGVAGAVRIDRSRRTVTAPGTAMFDGHSLVWSRDRARLAIATAPADPCAADEEHEVAVVDVDTGRLRTIDRGLAPPQLAWLAGGELAVARAGTITLYDRDGGATTTLAGAVPLTLWIRPARPACVGQPPPEPDPVPPEPEAEPEPEPEPEPGPRPAPARRRGAETTVVTPADAGR